MQHTASKNETHNTHFHLPGDGIALPVVVGERAEAVRTQNLHPRSRFLAQCMELASRQALLEGQGHTVIAVDLPGMGRDKTPVQSVTLELSVKKITDLIDAVDGKVILVGHSKNGIMISQAAEHRPDKIEKLVYLAAYLVPDGKTQREYSLQDTHGVLKPFVVRDDVTHSTTLKPDIYKDGLYHDCDNSIVEMAKLILSDEPVITGITPLHLTEENFGRVPRYYIECTEDRAVTPFIQQKMYTELPCRKVYKMKASHSPFFSQPDKLVEILGEIARLQV